MITIDEVKSPMRNINYLQGSSTISALRLNHSLAMEPQRTQDATKRVMRIVDAKYQKADLQSIGRDNILKHESKPLYNPQSFAQTLLEYKQTRKINLTQ